MTGFPHDATGLVLAGGRSRRFGADKARHRVDGRAMVRRAFDALRAATEAPVLVGVRRGQARFSMLPDAGMRYVEDAAPDAGPLAGLVAGLRAARTEWLLVLACDLPYASPQALRRLLHARGAEGGDVEGGDVEGGDVEGGDVEGGDVESDAPAAAVVAAPPGGPRQPLCACYRRRTVRPLAKEHLEARRLALRDLLGRLSVRTVPFDAETLSNVNRRSDLRE